MKTMPKSTKEEKLRWILPIFNKEVRLKDVAKICPHGKRTLERWLANYKKYGKQESVSKTLTRIYKIWRTKIILIYPRPS